MKILNYTPNIAGLTVIKNEDLQHRLFFCDGHPKFLIPDFNDEPYDIWITFMDYLEKEKGEKIWDQNGGEVGSEQILNKDSGLTKCKYTAYDISMESEKEEYDEYEMDIEGYVVSDGVHAYFAVTKIEMDI